jgi:hypothetical protein
MDVQNLSTEAAKNVLNQIIIATFGLAVSLLLYRNLTAEKYIIFSVMTILFYSLNYLNFGLPQLIIKEIAKAGSDPAKRAAAERGALSGMIIVFFVVALCLEVALPVVVERYSSELGITSSSVGVHVVVFLSLAFYFGAMFQRAVHDGRGEFSASRFNKLFVYFSYFATAYVVFRYSLTPAYVMYLIALLVVATFLLGKRNGIPMLVLPSIADANPFLRPGITIFFLSLVSIGLGNVDRLIAINSGDEAQVAAVFLVIDVFSRQQVLGAAFANISLRYFSISQSYENANLVHVALKVAVIYGVISAIFVMATWPFIGGFILNLKSDLSPVTAGAIWLSFSMLAAHTLQYQRAIAEGFVLSIIWVYLGVGILLYFVWLLFQSVAVAQLVALVIFCRMLFQIIGVELLFLRVILGSSR